MAAVKCINANDLHHGSSVTLYGKYERTVKIDRISTNDNDNSIDLIEDRLGDRFDDTTYYTT